MQTIKIIGKIGYYLILGALILIALVVMVSAFPIKGNIQIKVVESGSMVPALPTGSVVLIKPMSAYALGDIITFEGTLRDAKGQKVPVTHRLVDMRKEGGEDVYITKGDANKEPDTQKVLASQIIGKVLFSTPYVGYVVQAARTPYGFFAVVFIPAAIIIYSQLEIIWKEIKKMRSRREEEAPNN